MAYVAKHSSNFVGLIVYVQSSQSSSLSSSLQQPFPSHSLIPTNQFASPHGHVCLQFPHSNLHPFLSPSAKPSITPINSSAFLVLKQLTNPSNTTMPGTTGTTYVQNKCSQSPQNHHQLPSHSSGPNSSTVKTLSRVRACSSKIAKPEDVQRVFCRTERASGCGK